MVHGIGSGLLSAGKTVFPGSSRFVYRKMVGADITVVLENRPFEGGQGRTIGIRVIGGLCAGCFIQVMVPAMYRRGHKRVQRQ